MSLPPLSTGTTRAYLERLGINNVQTNAAGLAKLQQAHLCALPFHNLRLLQNDGADPGLPPVERAIDRNLAGEGGTCHLQTPPFAALLRALGFDVCLAAASIRCSDDHLIAVVTLDNRQYLCDVGNGHPYLKPWPLGPGTQEQEAYGWRFRLVQIESGEYVLSRFLPSGEWHRVYLARAAPRCYSSFTESIRRHHIVPSFGPFFSSLRASKILSTAFLTLRDDRYRRFDGLAVSDRHLPDRERTSALLHMRFNLPTKLIAAALETLGQRRPELWPTRSPLFQVPAWETTAKHKAWSRGAQAVLEERVQSICTDNCPQVLIAVSVTDRPHSLARLLRSLDEERRRFGYAPKIGVLIVDNSTSSESSAAIAAHASAAQIPTLLTPAQAFYDRIERCAAIGVLPQPSQPLPIASAREATLAAICRHWKDPWPALPHPNDGPLTVWIVDDDMAFCQLLADGRVHHATSLFHRIARYRLQHPELSVLIGQYTGDPPIPAIDALGVQLVDLNAHLAIAHEQGLDAPWQPPPPPELQDPYYDLNEGSSEHLSTPHWWRSSAATLGEALLELLIAFPRVLHGHQVTRPLVWDASERPPRPSLRRGGNAVFLDLDALFVWPTPSVRCDDGICTRRGDTIWATLADRDPDYALAEVTLPLHHGRFEQTLGSALGDRTAAALTTSQVRGTALARAIGASTPIAEILLSRRRRVQEHRIWLKDQVQSVRKNLDALAKAYPARQDFREAIDRLHQALDTISSVIAAAKPAAGGIQELSRLARGIDPTQQQWRESWR